ncbi:hypothetical protein ACFL5G_02835 [Candidatus Margulisiibacteriota bacterium]
MKKILLVLLVFIMSVTACMAMGEKACEKEEYVENAKNTALYDQLRGFWQKELEMSEEGYKKFSAKKDRTSDEELIVGDYADSISSMKELLPMNIEEYYEKVYARGKCAYGRDKIVTNADFTKHLEDQLALYKR